MFKLLKSNHNLFRRISSILFSHFYFFCFTILINVVMIRINQISNQIKTYFIQKKINKPFMADTAHKKDQDKVEHFDPEDVLNQKIDIIASLILNSKHFTAFTGAGISTACGIPDFRSGVNTVLKTGPGAWQKKAQKVKDKPNKNVVDSKKAIPSFTHMSLVALQKCGLLKFLISQNTDGLHLRSGFNPAYLAQLHGNRCLEKCHKCKSQFLRDFRTRQAQKVHDHITSRKCQKCGASLYDSIINFGQNLPQYQLNKSFEQGQNSDLCLAMGSSLTVTPAADIPKTVGKKGKLIIVNLQKTPLDKYAYIRVGALCDDFMKKLMKKLQIKVQQFVLTRLVQFKLNKEMDMVFRGVDPRGVPFSFFKSVNVASNHEKAYKSLKGQPYRTNMLKKDSIRIKFEFYGWLEEPPVTIQFQKERQGILKLVYDPKSGKWIQRIWDDQFKFEK